MNDGESAPAIVVEGLRKRFGDVVALDGIDFAVPAGTVLGLLGPNGAGKTTTVRVLTTTVRPDAGRARELVDDGATVLLTTQYLEEADRLAHRIVVVDDGRVIAEGTAAELKSRFGSTVVEVGFSNPAGALRARAVLARLAVREPEQIDAT